LSGVGFAVPFVDDKASEGVVVATFNLGFRECAGQVEAGAVFEFGDEALSVDVESGEVAAVFGAVADAPVDAVVDVAGEVVGDEAFESGAGLFRAGAAACHVTIT